MVLCQCYQAFVKICDSDSACSTASEKYYNFAMKNKAVVKNALAGRDVSDLRASFRQALSFSIPPFTLYHNYSPPGAYSELIFGVPLVDLETTQGNVPKVMRMCIEEVEKRGLKTKNIYLVSFSKRALRFVFSIAGSGAIPRRST
jgi:hypothetical protein